MKALIIGHSLYNLTCEVEGLPAENTTTNFAGGVESLGGHACNMAYTLGKLGVDTYLASTTGDDTYGNFVKKELEKIGVHTEYMEVAYEKRTNISLILNNKKNKSRTVFSIEREPLLLKKTEFQVEPDFILVDGYDYGASLAALNRFSSKVSIINAHTYNKETAELCKYCKYIIASKEFAEAMTGQKINYEDSQSLVYVFSQFTNKYPNKEIIITIEDRGALYMVNGQIKVMPGLQADILDTTGCGDIFRAAFGYALVKGYDPEKSITFANIACGLSVNKVGFINSIASLDEIMVYFKQKYGENVEATIQNNQQMAPEVQMQAQADTQASAPQDASQAAPAQASAETGAPATEQPAQTEENPAPAETPAPTDGNQVK